MQSSAVKRRWGYRAKGCRTLDRAGTNGANPAKAQSDVRASFSGRLVRESGGGDRETGVLKATGSYEGSLTTEGTSGHHEPSPFTRRWSRWPRRLTRISTARKSCKRQNAERRAKATAKWNQRESGDRSIRGFSCQAPWEQNAHAPDLDDETRRPLNTECLGCRTEAVADVVKRPFPRQARTDPKIRESAHAAKSCGSGPGARTYG